jgi:two-component system LytT family sensor kinase
VSYWQKLVEDKERFFWLLHTAGWFGFALIWYIGSFLHEMREVYLFVIILNAYSGWILILPLRYVYRAVWNSRPITMVLTILGASYVTAAIWSVVKNFNYWEIYKQGYRPDEWIYYFNNSLGSFYIVLCWSGLYFGIKYYQLLQTEREAALKTSKIAHQTQLKMLRYQLNPHFLFNTLNSISTLILVKENNSANKMVSQLSDFLRYSLDSDPLKQVPLNQEIEALNLYLEIEKTRFGERLQVDTDIAEDTQQALVPSLILQPIIENAIKYAIAKLENGGIITIKSRRFGNDLFIEIADNGPGADLDNGQLKRKNGVGLVNTEERLASLYEQDYSLSMSRNDPNGLKVSIRMPYKEKE